MVLALSEDDVSRIANVDRVVKEVEAVLREYSERKTVMPPRYVMERPNSDGTVRLMLASIPSHESAGLKILTGTAGKREAGRTYFLISLFDRDGSIRCLMSANRLTQLRTGAASAVATKYLARRNSKTIGVVGAGLQGRGQLEAICRVASFESGFVFDVFGEAANKMVEYAKEKLNLDMKVETSPSNVAAHSDVLVTTTTSKEPFLSWDMIMPGTHINAVGSNLPGRRELQESLLGRATVFVDSLEQVLKESGDLIAPIAAGAYSADRIAGEIGEVISGAKPGRVSHDQVTLFKSVGIAVEDVAVADLIFREALKAGIGTEVKL